MVLWAIDNAEGGEIFVPKIPSYRVTDVARAINPSCEFDVVGIRPGEKIHEEMITVSDSLNTVDRGDFYAILPSADIVDPDQYCLRTGAKRVPEGFSYNSGDNPHFLTVEELRDLIDRHVDTSH